MKICIAQTASQKGNVHKNIQGHLRIIEDAIELNSDLIVFPELSITAYEPSLAKELAADIEDEIFEPFQVISNKNNITIGVGMPINTLGGITISLLIFQPNKKRSVYSKQILHADELPYFVAGNKQVILSIKKHKIAFGICYESLQRAHFLNAKQEGATIYMASVAKSEAGIQKASAYFPKLAKEFDTPILMANGIGFCDNFLAAGQSALWNNEGHLVGQLDKENQGLLLYDTTLKPDLELN